MEPAGAVNLLLDVTAQRMPERRNARDHASGDELRMAAIETLARLSARIAGRDQTNRPRSN
jgi:hypothetical protein